LESFANEVIMAHDEMDPLQIEIYKIMNFDSKVLAEVLNISVRQARNIKKGITPISTDRAFLLKEKFDLSPAAFAEIRKKYIENKDKNE
jgi:plasmid maintenance system antidote protein VapI